MADYFKFTKGGIFMKSPIRTLWYVFLGACVLQEQNNTLIFVAFGLLILRHLYFFTEKYLHSSHLIVCKGQILLITNKRTLEQEIRTNVGEHIVNKLTHSVERINIHSWTVRSEMPICLAEGSKNLTFNWSCYLRPNVENLSTQFEALSHVGKQESYYIELFDRPVAKCLHEAIEKVRVNLSLDDIEQNPQNFFNQVMENMKKQFNGWELLLININDVIISDN